MQRAIIDGKKVTGITTMYMAEGLDTGDMLLKREVEIAEDDNFETVHDKLGITGAALIVETLDGVEKEIIARIPQDDSKSTYAAKITKEECLIDFSRPAKEIHDKIRGLSPIPLSFTHTPDGKLLKVWRAAISDRSPEGKCAGEIIALEDGITVACGEGAITLLGVLPEGKSKMNASDYIRGRKLSVGDILE